MGILGIIVIVLLAAAYTSGFMFFWNKEFGLFSIFSWGMYLILKLFGQKP